MISQEIIAKKRREGMRWNLINTLNKARPHTTSEVFLVDIMNAIYPQTTARTGLAFGSMKMILNPKGCWDWVGYTGPAYATKAGVQMAAIKAMVDRLTTQP